jgi:small subunit ribosomal protein S6
MVRDYELMYIVRPDADDDAVRAAVESVRTLVEGQGGEVRKTTMWGKRRLAYEVKHLRDGHYVIVEMRLDGARVANVERALRIHDSVFRHLLVVQEAPSADIEGEGDGETESVVVIEGVAPSNGVAPAEEEVSGDDDAGEDADVADEEPDAGDVEAEEEAEED